tara:strand:+ start:886 stop:1179 length:294 start_codon:yes stop_codon:yes gene_type:complete
MKFTDLEFRPHEIKEPLSRGIRVIVFFPNGYGASVVQTTTSYGGESGLYELAVLQGNKDKWHITYITPITSDVLGYLTPKDVEEALTAIEALEENKE